MNESTCPNCQILISCEDQFVGKPVICPGCNFQFTFEPVPPPQPVVAEAVKEKTDFQGFVFRVAEKTCSFATAMKPRIGTYFEKVGVRSFIFQLAFVVWCVLCSAGFVVYAGASFELAARQRAFERRNGYPDKGVASSLETAGICAPVATWFIFAFPLFIGAVATLKQKENDNA